MTDFLKNGALTVDGKRVVDTLTAWWNDSIKESNAEKINSLPGHAKHFGVNVLSLGTIRPEQWLMEHSTAAENVIDVLREADEKAKVAEQAASASSGMSDLESKFDALSKLVTEQAAEIAALKEAKAPVEAAKPADKKDKKDKKAETPDAETDEAE